MQNKPCVVYAPGQDSLEIGSDAEPIIKLGNKTHIICRYMGAHSQIVEFKLTSNMVYVELSIKNHPYVINCEVNHS